jgi:hypothetical protein
MMAGFLLTRAGITLPTEPMTAAPVHAADGVEIGGDGVLQARRGWCPSLAGRSTWRCRRGTPGKTASR